MSNPRWIGKFKIYINNLSEKVSKHEVSSSEVNENNLLLYLNIPVVNPTRNIIRITMLAKIGSSK